MPCPMNKGISSKGTMKHNTSIHHRRSVRLQQFDYSSEGGYFITICTHDKLCLLGDIQDEEMKLSETGKVVERCWLDIPNHFANVELDEFVVMPNHFHGIILIWNNDVRVGARHAVPLPNKFGKPQSRSLSTIIRSCKSAATKNVNEIRNTPGSALWQRGY